MDRMDALRIFSRVADMQSFTRAATALRLPKATVSLAVKRLEEEVGVLLLRRTTRVVRLTQEGELFHGRCRAVLADFEELEGLFRKSAGELTGRVRIDMSTALARSFFIPRLRGFHAIHPHIEVELGATDGLGDPVREGVDLAVRAGALAESSLAVRPLGAMQLANLASAAYVRAHGVPASSDDLEGHHLVGYASVGDRQPSSFEWLVHTRSGTELRRRPMRSLVVVSNTVSYLEACLAGLGIIQAPRYNVRSLVADGTLVELLPELTAPALPLSILHPHRRLTRRARALLDWFEPQLRAAIDA